MKLQLRTALVPLVTVSILCFGLYLLVSKLTVESFNQVETDVLRRQVERVNNSVTNLLDEHSIKIVDWAQWDKSYDFVETLDPSYIEVNLNALTLGALGYTSVLYLTPNMDLRYGVTVDGEEVKTADPQFVNEVQQILKQAASPTFQSLVRLQNKIYMLAASPILPNKADQPARGTLVAVAEVPAATLELVAYLTNLKLAFWETGKDAPDEYSRSATEQLKGQSFLVRPISDHLSYAYGKITDQKHKPLLFFRVESSRQIASSGMNVRTVSVTILSVGGLLASLLLFAVIYFSATKRIQEFSEQVQQIAKNADSSMQLSDSFRGSRTLRVKTASGVLLIFVFLTVFTSVFFNRYFLAGFRDVENKVMTDNLERAKRAVEGRLDKIKAKTIDWAQWDDTYNFVEDQNENYQSDNLGFDTLGHMNMKYVLYYNLEGKLAIGKHVQSENSVVVPVSAETAAEIAEVPALSAAVEPASGFASLKSEILLAASSPILDTTREKPRRGSMVFATAADKSLSNELGRQTRLDLSFAKPTATAAAGENYITPRSDIEITGETSIADLLGKPALTLLVRSDRPVFAQGLLSGKILPWYFTLVGVLCAAITVIWVDRSVLSRIRQMGEDLSIIGLTGTAGKRVQTSGRDELAGLANDINSMLNALQKAEQEVQAARLAAEQANAAKSIFIAKVSHELRTPIGSITGMHRMILKQETSKAVKDLVKIADRSAWNLLSILNEILDFSKAESGNLTLECIEFDVRQVLRDTMEVLSGRLEGRDGLELILDVDPAVPATLKGDPTKLKQVLINLLGNAVKFTQKGCVGLRVERERTDGSIPTFKFDVWDTGIGIPEAKLGSIFEPFKQADETVARQYQGTGLGLAIVKQFTEAQGGSVSVTSEPGKGTTFTARLPLEVAGSDSYTVPNDHRSMPSAVLLGADTNVNSVLLKNLGALGVKATRAESAEQLSDRELVIVTEGALSQPKLCSAVLELAERTKACIVAVVRSSSLNLRDKLDAAGITHILPTPATAEDILLAYFEQQPEATSAQDEPNLQVGRKLRILVADDTPTNRIILEDMLSEAGHTVTLVSDGQELVDRLSPSLTGQPDGEHFDIVFTDISMPIVDGYTATRMVRELEKLHSLGIHVPIVAITAHAMKDEEENMQAAGVDGIVTKPVRPEAIAAELQRLIAAR